MGKILGRMILFAAATIVAAQFMVAQVRIRDPKQAIDEEYTKKIREYTTEPFFNSPWTDYLPASPTVPAPKAVLGDVAGAPNKLPYSTDVYRYMRMLERATGRVKVVSIGTTEEGREMIAVAVASEKLIADLEQNRSRLARLSDPRADPQRQAVDAGHLHTLAAHQRNIGDRLPQLTAYSDLSRRADHGGPARPPGGDRGVRRRRVRRRGASLRARRPSAGHHRRRWQRRPRRRPAPP